MQLFMNGLIKYFSSDKTVLFGCSVSVAFILITFFYTLLSYASLPPFIPLFNQLPWGDTRIATKEYIFLPLIISFVIFITNFFLASWIYTKIPLIARMLIVTNFLVCTFMFLFIVRVILLVG